jgi:hypothetical protein
MAFQKTAQPLAQAMQRLEGRLALPEAKVMEQIARYEAHHSRELHKAYQKLEALQLRRAAAPPAPPTPPVAGPSSAPHSAAVPEPAPAGKPAGVGDPPPPSPRTQPAVKRAPEPTSRLSPGVPASSPPEAPLGSALEPVAAGAVPPGPNPSPNRRDRRSAARSNGSPGSGARRR